MPFPVFRQYETNQESDQGQNMKQVFRNESGMIWVLAALMSAVIFVGCDPDVAPSEEKPLAWDLVIKGLEEPIGSATFTSAMISLSSTWREHGEEGARLMTARGVEVAGLAANGAIGDVSYLLGTKSYDSGPKYHGRLLASLTEAAKLAPEDWFRDLVNLASLFGIGGQKDLQLLVDLADAGTHELAESFRLSMAGPLADALIAASSSIPGERGRVILERLPGWPSPPTQNIMETLFPANIIRISRWIAEGTKLGGLHEKAWGNVAERLSRGFNGRMFDIPVVVSAEARVGTPMSAILGKYQPLEVVHVTSSGALIGLRPVLEWKDSFVQVASGDATWPMKAAEKKQDVGDAPAVVVDDALSSLPARAASLRTLADTLEKAVYPQFVGSGVLSSEREQRAVLLAVDPDASADLLAKTVSVLSGAGYSDFRILTPGPVGSMNPLMANGKTGDLSMVKTVRVFLTAKGASLFANPYVPLGLKDIPVGSEAIKKGNDIGGLSVSWDAVRGFSGNVTVAFANLGPAAAGTVDVAEIMVASSGVPAAMFVDVISELQAAPGIKFSRIEAVFPGLICPQGRSCPGVVPVLGGSARAPINVR